MKKPPPRNQIFNPTVPPGLALKVIGAGGVGEKVIRPVAVFLAAQSVDTRLVVIDGDEYEASNATRMLFDSYGNKAAVICDELMPRFADSDLALVAIEEFVTLENCDCLIQEGDVVMLTVDNHATRKLVNDYCANLSDVCLISGGNDGVERLPDGRVRRGTYGNVQIYVRRDGRDLAPSLSRFHPEIATPADYHPLDQNCTELITSVPQIIFTNQMVAAAILNTFWLYLSDTLHYGELAFDIADGLMRPVDMGAK